MEYELIYHTRLYVVCFAVSVWGVEATIYNKDVATDQEWITVCSKSEEHDQSTDFRKCRELLKAMRKEHKI